MSLILDALNKAEDERNKSHSPSLNSTHGSGNIVASSKHQQHILIGLCLAVTVLFVVIIFLLFAKNDGKTTHTSTNTKTPMLAEQKANTEAIKVKAFTSPSALGENNLETKNSNTLSSRSGEVMADDTYQRMKEKQIAAQYQNAQKQREQTALVSNTKANTNTEKVTKIYEQSSNVNAQPTSTASPKVKEKAIEEAPSIPIKTLADFPTLSSIGALAYSVQKKIPTVMYTEHTFSPSGDNFVKLNNTKRRAGQQIADNLILEEIVEDGIIVKHGNLRFKMSALNSWVNI